MIRRLVSAVAVYRRDGVPTGPAPRAPSRRAVYEYFRLHFDENSVIVEERMAPLPVVGNKSRSQGTFLRRSGTTWSQLNSGSAHRGAARPPPTSARRRGLLVRSPRFGGGVVVR